jgi:hypothetical protein
MGHEKINYGTVDPRTTLRRSANTHNTYTMYMDNSPIWSDFPKRSHSMICSSGYYAEDFGNLYAVFPYDNTPIGICPDFDLWESFPRLRRFDVCSLPQFTGAIMKVLSYAHAAKPKEPTDIGSSVGDDGWSAFARIPAKVEKAVHSSDWENFVKLASKVNATKIYNKIKSEDGDRTEKDILLRMIEDKCSIVDVMDLVMNPKDNGFVSCRGNNFHTYLRGENQEVWVGGPAIVVSLNKVGRTDLQNDLIEKLGLHDYVTPRQAPKPKIVPPKVAAPKPPIPAPVPLNPAVK